MESIGIICEFNPFHNGHKYFIKKIKENFKNSNIILVMSGNFTQRGDFSLINKWDKTKIALKNDIDLVIELPTLFTIQSADVFSYAAINILKNLKVDYIIFGSESNDIKKIIKLAKEQLNEEYNKKVHEQIKKGINYPTALNNALSDTINNPNDILGLSYVREIIKQNSNITPLTIKRTNNYHDTNLTGNITSANSIRKNINKDIKKFVPKITFDYLQKNVALNEKYFIFLKYKIISEINNLNIYLDVDEGIENKIKKVIFQSNNLDELINNVKSKRYTYSKLKRMFMHILLSIKKEDNIKQINYIRILGFNKNGQNYLNKIKKEVNIPIYTNFNKDLENELKFTRIYSIIFDEKYKKELEKKEITELIKM